MVCGLSALTLTVASQLINCLTSSIYARTVLGVPVVLEQKTTILWKCLYLLASLKDSSGLGGTYETKRRSEEENPVHRQNTTVNVDKIRGFHPLYAWR